MTTRQTKWQQGFWALLTAAIAALPAGAGEVLSVDFHGDRENAPPQVNRAKDSPPLQTRPTRAIAEGKNTMSVVRAYWSSVADMKFPTLAGQKVLLVSDVDPGKGVDLGFAVGPKEGIRKGQVTIQWDMMVDDEPGGLGFVYYAAADPSGKYIAHGLLGVSKGSEGAVQLWEYSAPGALKRTVDMSPAGVLGVPYRFRWSIDLQRQTQSLQVLNLLRGCGPQDKKPCVGTVWGAVPAKASFKSFNIYTGDGHRATFAVSNVKITVDETVRSTR